MSTELDRAMVVRLVALYAPITIAGVAWAVHPPRRRQRTALLLACGWLLPSLFLVNAVALRAGWWSFAPVSASIGGVPGDLLLGWVALWGSVPVLLLSRLPVALILLLLALLDVAVMPLGAPVVVLHDGWLAGEALALAVALLPALLLARWTIAREHVALRGGMQAAAFGTIALWLLPELVFATVGGDWSHLLRTWNRFGGVHVQLAAIPLVLGIASVQEFAHRGGGTPIPFDPPRRLVTSGPYAYVANPMQLSMALALTLWGMVLGNPWVALAGPMAVAWGLGLAGWDERGDLGGRFGAAWEEYRRHVREWIPRWRPYHVRPAQLYVAATCGPCTEVATWFTARGARGLEIVPAELHPARDLCRITYDPADGTPEEEGLAALGRALEHIHLGWALAGWTVRLPLLGAVLQLVADASGGEARRVPRMDPAALQHALAVRTCQR